MQSLPVGSQAFTCSVLFAVQDAGDRYLATCFQEP